MFFSPTQMYIPADSDHKTNTNFSCTVPCLRCLGI